jgi:hypothetical protein
MLFWQKMAHTVHQTRTAQQKKCTVSYHVPLILVFTPYRLKQIFFVLTRDYTSLLSFHTHRKIGDRDGVVEWWSQTERKERRKKMHVTQNTWSKIIFSFFWKMRDWAGEYFSLVLLIFFSNGTVRY